METCFELPRPVVKFALPKMLVAESPAPSPRRAGEAVRGKKPRIAAVKGEEGKSPSPPLGDERRSVWPLTHHLRRLPVPALDDTRRRLLVSAAALLHPDALAELTDRLDAFLQGPGLKAQHKLKALSLSRSNWLEDIWMRERYTRRREALPVAVSPGILLPAGTLAFEGLAEGVGQLGRLVAAASEFYDLVCERRLPPQTDALGGPLDMSQFDALFGATRLPRPTEDAFAFRSARLEHFVVAHRGRFFRCPLQRKMAQGHLESALRKVLAESDAQEDEEAAGVGLGTGAGRDDWALFRDSLCQSAHNADVLDVIDSAAFLLCLDQSSEEEAESREWLGGNLLHGAVTNAPNRWFDKTLALIVTERGGAGILYEHSQMEGTPVAALAEHIVRSLRKERERKSPSPEEAPQSGRPSCLRPEAPSLLRWHLGPNHRAAINDAADLARTRAEDLCVSMLTFEDFGKEKIKALRLSPDSFVQTAISVAFWRTRGEVSAQYETGTLRVFRRGRTATIRLPLAESAALCRDAEERPWEAGEVRAAVEAHKALAGEACGGQGWDRHLLGLRSFAPAAKETQALEASEGWAQLCRFRLSTSQLPSQEELLMLFGPTEADGFGVCYSPRPQALHFALTARPDQDLPAFRQALHQTLVDLASSLESP